MKTKYLYIDDQIITADGFAKGLSKENLIIDLEEVEEWNNQIETLKSKQNDYDGILLDLQLKFPAEEIKFDAPALAQQLRNLSKENEFIALPILLCTTNEKYKILYDKNTNDDLFDLVYIKGEWSENVTNEFIALANGYKTIRNSNGELKDILKNNNKELLNLIDEKISDNSTVHSIASFVLKQLILSSGLLIDEELLAIRLGIDKNKSPNWKIILDNLEQFKYQGVFSEGWERWWFGDIMKWWREISDNTSLRTLDAGEKVSLLKVHFKADELSSIELPDKHSDSAFWYKCVFSNIPMSSYDGFLVKAQDTKLDWQDKDYISNYFIWSVKKKSKEDEILKRILTTDFDKVSKMFIKKREN